jgi:exopolysaccharide biosynthesis polyprenyl glycosylphosphotransferase
MIMILAFILSKVNRMRVLVLDGVNAGDVSAHGHIRLDYSDLAGQAITIDAVVATRGQMQDPSWQGFLTTIALHQIPVLTDSRYREITQGQVNLNDTDAAELIQMPPVRRYALIKRLMDVVMALLALVVLSPLLLLVTLLIRLETPGNSIFVQERVGLTGRPFRMLKFRSMVNEAEKSGAKFAAVNDSRITRMGRIIRPSRIDELPQLINVLFGQMSLIGPRPEQQAMVDQLSAEIPLYDFRHAVRPGITGWAQVMQGYADDVKSTDTKLSFDLFYIKNISLMMDIVIFFRTIRTILTGFGAR